jgi:hypothetical protein
MFVPTSLEDPSYWATIAALTPVVAFALILEIRLGRTAKLPTRLRRTNHALHVIALVALTATMSISLTNLAAGTETVFESVYTRYSIYFAFCVVTIGVATSITAVEWAYHKAGLPKLERESRRLDRKTERMRKRVAHSAEINRAHGDEYQRVAAEWIINHPKQAFLSDGSVNSELLDRVLQRPLVRKVLAAGDEEVRISEQEVEKLLEDARKAQERARESTIEMLEKMMKEV